MHLQTVSFASESSEPTEAGIEHKEGEASVGSVERQITSSIHLMGHPPETCFPACFHWRKVHFGSVRWRCLRVTEVVL